METPKRCIVCHSTDVKIAVHVPRVPVLCNVLWTSREEALAVPKVDIDLAFCHTCGHLFNPGFDPELMVYTQEYENSLHFSPRFQEYASKLAADLVARHQLPGKNVIELGSGKGDFLELLCTMGKCYGVGFDKSYVPKREVTEASFPVRYFQDWYSERYAGIPVDFVVCRHTLEHIADPRTYLRDLRQILHKRSRQQPIALFFEVPNALFTLRDLAIWDIIYEHCSYYSKYSLNFLFATAGFKVTKIWEAYAGQFLCIEAIPADGATAPAADLHEIAREVATFAQRYEAKTSQDRRELTELQRANKKIVIWGSGSKGVTFLNMLQLQDQVTYAVDINPRKQGKFITGSGQKIVAPEFLREYKPDVVYVMNAVYLEEINQTLNNLDLAVDVRTG